MDPLNALRLTIRTVLRSPRAAGAGGPLTMRRGEVVLEASGTVHGWRNESGARTRVLVVDIVRPE